MGTVHLLAPEMFGDGDFNESHGSFGVFLGLPDVGRCAVVLDGLRELHVGIKGILHVSSMQIIGC